MPGRALSFVCDTTQDGGVISITTYPSKIRALHCHAAHDMMMARSDSNGEDLQDFAGAGLYSSVPIPMSAYHNTPVSYDQEPLIWNDTFRNSIIHTLSQIAQDIETACQCPQDIEGVVAFPDAESPSSTSPSVHVVQTRPQIIQS
jgi:alpha-glucan,water dikinase